MSATPKFQVGDRVKMRGDADTAIATVVGFDDTGDPVFYYEDEPNEWQCPLVEKIELVSRPVYMTPERIDALEWAAMIATDRGRIGLEETFSEMLAEARDAQANAARGEQ